MDRIEQGYQTYLKSVNLSEETMGENQRVELRRGFYAGFGHCLAAISAVGAEDITVEQGAEYIEQLCREHNEYWKKEIVKTLHLRGGLS
jgi:hypothetical protein